LKEEEVVQAEKPINHAKGVFWINVHYVCLSFNFLLLKVLYNRMPNLSSNQVLCVRSMLSSLWLLVALNKKIKFYMWESVPEGMVPMLIFRSILAYSWNLLTLEIVRYFSLVYQGISMNAVPIITSVMSFFLLGETLKRVDILMVVITFFGVTLVTLGFKKTEKISTEIPLTAYLACFFLPVLLSYGNILMRRMAGVNLLTNTCYMNLLQACCTMTSIYATNQKWTVFSDFEQIDYIIIVFCSGLTIWNQTIKFLAFQHELPGKLTPY
jgi:drug/metabolite transporter (DMT)-like permease